MKTVISILFLLSILFTSTMNGQVSVIVHKSVPVQSLTAAAVYDIYSLTKRYWNENLAIVVFNQKTAHINKQFHNFIGKTPLELKKIWLRIQLSGQGKAPESLESDEEVLAKVATTPGAIGFISSDKVKGDVKVVATIE